MCFIGLDELDPPELSFRTPLQIQAKVFFVFFFLTAEALRYVQLNLWCTISVINGCIWSKEFADSITMPVLLFYTRFHQAARLWGGRNSSIRVEVQWAGK